MRSIALLPVTLCLIAGVAGCGSRSDSDSGGSAGDPDVVYLRGLNAVSNGPGMSYLTLTERPYETDAEAPDATESIAIGPLPFEALGGQVPTLLILPGQTGATEDALLLDDLAP
jgi:hypothetical protein